MQACVVFFDEVDAIGGARFDDGAGGDNEVQRTMLEIVNQLDGFDARGNVKVGAERGCRTWDMEAGARVPVVRLFGGEALVRMQLQSVAGRPAASSS